MNCRELQIRRIVKMLKKGWVTGKQAYEMNGGMKLSTRVSDLRKAGYKIKDKWVDVICGNRVKAYRIIGG